MKKICCLLLLLSCFALQACEKADNLKYETSSYANFSASENSENIAKTEDTAETENTEIEELIGGIYCAEDKIIMETNEEQIELASERFFLQPDENMICVYEGTMELETVKHRYALYKETAEQDIIFVNVLLVEEETGDYYTWEGENLVPVSRQEIEKIKLPDTSESETESELLYQNITVEELLDKVMELLKQQGYSEFNLIYDGTTDFIDRTYYIVCTYEDFEDHIIREQDYYIDRKTGYLYHVEEEPDFLRTELYYLGDLQF